MDPQPFTIIDDGHVVECRARVAADSVRLDAATVGDALGWELKAQGLCKDDRCIATRSEPQLVSSDGIDLAALARLLCRPLALDAAERTACLGTSAEERIAQLASLEAPEFTLPDLNGRLHALSDYRGKKILLVAYASW